MAERLPAGTRVRITCTDEPLFTGLTGEVLGWRELEQWYWLRLDSWPEPAQRFGTIGTASENHAPFEPAEFQVIAPDAP